MPLPNYQDACFVLDPSAGLNAANQWVDSGKFGLHITPGAALVAPNYGLAINTKGTPYINFTAAANCFGTMPLRFYDNAPTNPYTWVAVYQHNSVSDGTIFSCNGTTGGNEYGTVVYARCAGNSLSLYNQLATAANPRIDIAQLSGAYTRCVVGVVAATPRGVQRSIGTTASWVGAWGTPIYDTTVAPRIGWGYAPSFGIGYNGRLYHLSLWPFEFSFSTARDVCRWWVDRI
jgi:hypothetical protein